MAKTTIEWCSYTTPDGRLVQGYSWSPWRGCAKVSEGCRHCYAEARSRQNPKILGEWGPKAHRAINADWGKPIAWDRAAEKAGERRRVFPSLCDVFEERPDLEATRRRFFLTIEATPHLDWLILTKRPEHARDWLRWYGANGGLWPMPNLWLGASVEDQATADERVPVLLEIPAAVRWLSVEPLLGPIKLADLERPAEDEQGYDWLYRGAIDWVVVGGESGPRARPCDVQWLRSVVGQCREAGVAAFVKQLGSRPVVPCETCQGNPYWSKTLSSWKRCPACGLKGPRHPKGGDIDEFPPDLRVREFPTPTL